MLYLDKVMQDPNRLVQLVTPSNGVVKGFITSDFTVSGGSDWNDPSSTSDLLEKGNRAWSSFTQAANALGTSFANQRVVSTMDSVYTWQGSKRPSFTVDLIFVAVREGDDVRDPARRLLAAAYPDRSGLSLTAPGGYTTDAFGRATNTCILKVGKWFLSRDLVIEDVTANFSKAILKSGLPKHCMLTVSFSPYRVPDKDTMSGYLNT